MHYFGRRKTFLSIEYDFLRILAGYDLGGKYRIAMARSLIKKENL